MSSYLSPGDVIVSLDGIKIRNTQDWIEMAISVEKQMLSSDPTINKRTYCVPSSLLEKSETALLTNNQSACPDEHYAFLSVPCFGSSYSSGKDAHDSQRINNRYCLGSADIARLKSCGSLWTTSDNSCVCSEVSLVI